MSSKRDELIKDILPKIILSRQLDEQVATFEEERKQLEAKLTAAVKASIEGNNNKLYGGHNDGK